MKRSKAGTKKTSPDGLLSHRNQNKIIFYIRNIMFYIYKWYFIKNVKVQWNSINKKQNGLK